MEDGGKEESPPPISAAMDKIVETPHGNKKTNQQMCATQKPFLPQSLSDKFQHKTPCLGAGTECDAKSETSHVMQTVEDVTRLPTLVDWR